MSDEETWFTVDDQALDLEVRTVAAKILSGEKSPSAGSELIRIARDTQRGYAMMVADRAAKLIVEYMLAECSMAEVTFVGRSLNSFLHAARAVALGIEPPKPNAALATPDRPSQP